MRIWETETGVVSICSIMCIISGGIGTFCGIVDNGNPLKASVLYHLFCILLTRFVLNTIMVTTKENCPSLDSG